MERASYIHKSRLIVSQCLKYNYILWKNLSHQSPSTKKNECKNGTEDSAVTTVVIS